MARSVWLRFPRVFGGPALAERHAVTHEVSAIFKLRVFENCIEACRLKEKRRSTRALRFQPLPQGRSEQQGHRRQGLE
jgi:hypothetical protein